MSNAQAKPRDFSWWPWLLPMLLAALALRIGAGLLWPNIHQPDEIFQTLEPAHRLASGYGIVTWEWREGIRSWFVPGLLAAVIAAVDFLGLGAPIYIGAIVALLSLFSLTIVAVGFSVGARLFGRPGAILVGGLCAVWFEFIYFAPKAFSEVIAAHVLIIAAWLAQDTTRPRRFFLIGVLLGLACMLRFQIAPMALVAAIWLCRGAFRERWFPLLAGIGIPVLAQAVLDWITLGLPLQSIWLNVWINVMHGRSGTYGELPFYWYPGRLLLLWGPIMPPVVALTVIGARRLKLFGWMVLAHVIAHSLIAHKEMRFLYPAMPLLIILAGVGLCSLLSRIAASARGFEKFSGGALALLAMASLLTATAPGFSGNWTRMAGGIRGMDFARAQKDLCGLALVDRTPRMPYAWSRTGGAFHLHRAVPITLAADTDALAARAQNFNIVLAPLPPDAPPRGFSAVQCWPGAADDPKFCLFHRPGACTPEPGFTINEVLARQDQ